ncbi:MAG: dihydrofolate reductase, partial [Malacoplasma sp.]|nr:dihydrofolate reductase [Malacoplasma sp.]
MDRGISKNNKIPWHIQEDMNFFKETTLNSTIIMGRKTFESIGKPLPKRNNVVLTRNKNWKFPNVEVFYDSKEIIEEFNESKEIVYVIGGKEIYDIFIPYSKKLLVSKLNQSYDCDIFMGNNFHDFKLESKKQFNDFTLYIY